MLRIALAAVMVPCISGSVFLRKVGNGCSAPRKSIGKYGSNLKACIDAVLGDGDCNGFFEFDLGNSGWCGCATGANNCEASDPSAQALTLSVTGSNVDSLSVMKVGQGCSGARKGLSSGGSLDDCVSRVNADPECGGKFEFDLHNNNWCGCATNGNTCAADDPSSGAAVFMIGSTAKTVRIATITIGYVHPPPGRLAQSECPPYRLTHRDGQLYLVAVDASGNPTPGARSQHFNVLQTFKQVANEGLFTEAADNHKSCVRVDSVPCHGQGCGLRFNKFETSPCTKQNSFDKETKEWTFQQQDLFGEATFCMSGFDVLGECPDVIPQDTFGKAQSIKEATCGSGWTAKVVSDWMNEVQSGNSSFAESQERPWTRPSCDQCRANLGDTFVCAIPSENGCTLTPDEGSCTGLHGIWCGNHPSPSICCGEGQVNGYCCRDFGSECLKCGNYTYGVTCKQSNGQTYNAPCGPPALEPSPNATITVV